MPNVKNIDIRTIQKADARLGYLNYFPLCKVLDANHPLYRHLYVDVNASPDGLSFYNGGLPGWFLSIMQCAAVYYFFC